MRDRDRVARQPRAEVLVAVTWGCNLACDYCFVREEGLMEPGAVMSPATARATIDGLDASLPYVDAISVHLYGGEPLLNIAAIEAMLDRAEQKPPGRFTFAVTTNGTCTSPRAIAALGRGCFNVILSIDGPPEIHDACRRTTGGAPTHERVMRFLDALRAETDCWVRGSAVVRSGWGLREATDYLRTLPVDAIKAQAVRGVDGTPYALDGEERGRYLGDLDYVGRRVIAELEEGRAPSDDRFSARVLQLLAGTRRESFCGAGDTVFGVAPDGTVTPCILMDPGTAPLGHVAETGWVERGKAWRASRSLRAECRACDARDLCGGGCPALMPVCGDDECTLIRKNCEVARAIHDHFADEPEALLALAGIT